MRVALVHDWLNGMRGGERVLEVLCEIFPAADIFTLLCEPVKLSPILRRHRITSSFISRLPWARTRYRHYLPLFPTAIEQFDLRGYDLVVSTSHCVAKGVITPPQVPHFCYCHTPMRYAWEQYHEYFNPQTTGRVARWLIPWFMTSLRQWDVVSSQRVDLFMANSQHVARRIKKYYNREAVVVHPPVSAERFSPAAAAGAYYLVVSALVPYKRVDRAILACRLAGEKLVVVGNGPELKKLKALAGKDVTFVTRASEGEIVKHYAHCRALLFSGEEDFGITPLEAMASGRPVVAYAVGGVTESVQDGVTGVFFQDPTPEAMAAAMARLAAQTWDPDAIRKRALEFDRPVFAEKLRQVLAAAWQEKTGGELWPPA